MDKLKMHSLNKVDQNIGKIGKLFPSCLTERIVGYEKDENGSDIVEKSIIEYAIDFDMLRQELSSVVVEGNEERYQFTWPDKKKSVLLANAPIAKTLRPCREESVDFDSTENLYIEGDNLDVLKLLQETYLGKVKMIYIDPPYNTGNDFVYEDDFAQSTGQYLENSGQFDDEGNRLVKNLDSNGRFHTDWLNMIYPRLKLAKDLLADDGVIFISIDDNEVAQLRKICDEVFGEANFVASVVWERSYAPINLKKHFSESHDHVLCYAKSIASLVCFGLPRSYETNAKYGNPDNDPRGLWRTDNLSVGPVIADKVYEIVTPSGRKCLPPKGRCWVYTKARYEQMVADNRIWFGENGDNVPAPKRFLAEVKQGMTPMTIWKYGDVGHNQDSMRELRELFDGEKVFDYSKPVKLIKQMLSLYTKEDDIVLDFFSGSATTAHAIMQLNAEDGGNRKFIMVQLPEETDEKSEAYKAGYKNICEIGKERIRRAGAKIQEENNKLKDVPLLETEQDAQLFVDIAQHGKDAIERTKSAFNRRDISKFIDTGFRVLKLDSTNMKDVYYNPADYEADLFSSLTDNIKDDRTPEDLLFQVMLDLGVLLSSKVEESVIAGKKVFNVADGFLIACFDKNVNEETIKAIAQKKPYYFVMRDSSMANDSVATNFEQIFATYSPDTVRKVL